MTSKSRKRSKVVALSKENAISIWKSLESSAQKVEQHASFRAGQSNAEKKAKETKKEKNRVMHATARAERETASRLTRDIPQKAQQRPIEQPVAASTLAKAQEPIDEVPILPVISLFNFPKVEIHRDAQSEAQRSQLPVIRHEQEIMEKVLEVSDKTCIVVSGDTGTGKTTQVPQFLWEYGFPGLIGVTQPRRVAVYAMAERLRRELGIADEVGYQVRHDRAVDREKTRMKFMTEGILLREIQQDFALRRYSALIIDEVHERSVDCDMLLGLLSRIIPLRRSLGQPLAVILMSATMNKSIFTANSRLFAIPPPIISVEARRYELTEHYALRSSTRSGYLDDAFDKCVQIHTKLPHGAILCFVPTQKDCEALAARLQEHFDRKPARPYKKSGAGAQAASRKEKHDFMLEKMGAGESIASNEEPIDVPAETFTLREVEVDDSLTSTGANALGTLYALPLYANLEEKRQRLVFEPSPDDKRLCVIATNVAETSLTIPEVRYVVDTGYVKERNYDPDANTYRSCISRISMSSARQRAGRAGRTMPGHVYRLYTPACYGSFAADGKPEIERTPIERVVLLLSVFGVNPRRFPFPSEVQSTAIERAVERLTFLGAIEAKNDVPGVITPLGREIMRFPVVPRLAAILVRSRGLPTAVQHRLIDAVAVASTSTMFFQKSDGPAAESTFISPGSDYMSYALFIEAFRKSNRRVKLCRTASVLLRTASDAYKLSTQLHHLLGVAPNENTSFSTSDEILFRKALCKGFLDSIAKHKHVAGASRAVYTHGRDEYRLHPSSHCSRVRPPPEFVAFSTIESTAAEKKRLSGLTIVTMEWLIALGYDGDII